MNGRGAVALLMALCALPHLVRLVMPVAAMTDGFYAHAALMLARGHEPYVDFTQVAFPLAEGLLALVLRLTGPDIVVVELANNVVVLAVALAVFGVGRRLSGPWAGALAALSWSWCTWVVHFNLFERETWTALGTALALLAYLGAPGDRPLGARRLVLVVAALVLAFVTKITAVMVAAGLCLHLALTRGVREAVRLGLAYTAGLLLVTGLAWLVWGWPFLWQTFVFGFFRNARPGALEAFLLHLDVPMALGLLGLVVHALPRLRAPVGAVVCVFALDAVYALGISPTLWDHNMINFALTLAILGGVFADRLLSGPRAAAAAVALVLVAGTVGVARLSASETIDWKPRRYGLGLTEGRRRDWLTTEADFVREHSGPDDVIVCVEPWVAFAADRVKFVRYWDLQPVALGVEASLAADGLAATMAKRGDEVLLLGAGNPPHDPRVDALHDKYVARLVACALHHVRPRLLAALAEHRVALVLEPLLEGVLTPADLEAAGYERVTRTIPWAEPGPDGEPLMVERTSAGWIPADGVVRPGLLPVYARTAEG